MVFSAMRLGKFIKGESIRKVRDSEELNSVAHPWYTTSKEDLLAFGTRYNPLSHTSQGLD